MGDGHEPTGEDDMGRMAELAHAVETARSISTHTLHNSVVAYQRLRESLLAQYPSLAEDEQALVDTLDGISDLDLAIAAVMRSREDDLAMIEALKRRTEDMAERLARFANRADAKKAAVFSAMQAANRRKIEFPEFTLSVSAGRASVRIIDESRIPPAYLKVTTAPDKTVIGETLKKGTPVPGAELSNSQETLTVRRK